MAYCSFFESSLFRRSDRRSMSFLLSLTEDGPPLALLHLVVLLAPLPLQSRSLSEGSSSSELEAPASMSGGRRRRRPRCTRFVSRSLRQRKHEVPVNARQQAEHAATAILQLFFATHLMMPTLHMRYTKKSTAFVREKETKKTMN